MEPNQASIHTENKEVRERSGTAFPSYGLPDSIAVAKVLYEKCGGRASREQIAALLAYKSTDNGAFRTRVAAARTFGLIDSPGLSMLAMTSLGHKILMPETTEQLKANLVEAFFLVPLFKAIYEEYKGKDLPEGLGLKNALRLKFKIVPGRIELAYRVFFESAETAGFFETRGSRTQLIVPLIRPSPTKPDELTNQEAIKTEDASKGGGGGPPSTNVKSRQDLQNEYIATLIEALRASTKDGEMNKDLMERIERLLDLKMTG